MGILMHIGLANWLEEHGLFPDKKPSVPVNNNGAGKDDEPEIVPNEPFESGPFSILRDGDKWIAKLDDISREGFELSREYVVDAVEYNRTLVEGRLSTMCMPFSFNTSNFGGAKIYRIVGFIRNPESNKPSRFDYEEYPADTIIPANTPVIIIGDGTGAITFSDEKFVITQKIEGMPIENYGIAYGSYSVYKITEDDPNLRKVYGFAAATGNPVVAGVGASIPPFKCYVLDTYEY